MQTQADIDESENNVVDDELETEVDTEQENPGEADDEGSDEVVVTIGGESPTPEEEEAETAPEWVRNLRKSDREKSRRIRELEAQVTQKAVTDKTVELGPKPKLEDCGYDEEKFESELEAWTERKRSVAAKEESKRKDEEAQQASWQERVSTYEKAKAGLKVKDYDDAESVARDTLSTTQQGIIVNGADNAALLVYAIGKNPAKAKELASITDPVKFAFAVSKLETKLTVNRKVVPPPEKSVRGSAPAGGIVDKNLERLRAEADKTGDRSKVVRYIHEKKQLRK